MTDFKKIKIGEKYIQVLSLKLSSKTLIVLSGKKGYIMCGYLDMKVANKFKDVAVKIVGVSNIKQALNSCVYSVSKAAKKLGIRKGQAIKDVLKIIS